jgi:hypothetical protein
MGCRDVVLRDKIRRRLLEGTKSKRQVAREFGVSENTVKKYTDDLILMPLFKGIKYQDRRLELMRDLTSKGYAMPCERYDSQDYIELKTLIPGIFRTHVDNRTVYYLKGHEKEAAQAALESIDRKIFSYRELVDFIKAFKTDLSKEEKMLFLVRNKAKVEAKRFETKKPEPRRYIVGRQARIDEDFENIKFLPD